MLDNDTAIAKTVNGFKKKLEREQAKKMGLYMDECLPDPEAITDSEEASMQVSSS